MNVNLCCFVWHLASLFSEISGFLNCCLVICLALLGFLLSDLRLGSNLVQLFLHRSKTDQLGRGRWIKLRQLPGSICSVSLLRKYLAVCPALGSFLLIHSSGHPLTIYQFNSVLRKCLRMLDLAHLRITSHSFRIGAAIETTLLGFSVPAIKSIGGWSSDCYCYYTRPNFSV